MPISEPIAALNSIIDETKSELARVTARIDELKAERLQIVNAPPHTDDIIAVFMRGVADEAGAFERQFTARLRESFTGSDGKSAEAVAPGRVKDVLRTDTRPVDREEQLTRGLAGRPQPELNVGALMYFLRDQIVEELPAMIDRLLPEARNGMSKLVRVTKLEGIEQAIATLSAEQDRLMADLMAVRSKFTR